MKWFDNISIFMNLAKFFEEFSLVHIAIVLKSMQGLNKLPLKYASMLSLVDLRD